MPSPVLGEIGYLLQPRAGPQAEVTFLRSSGGDGFKVAELQGTDIGRMAELVETHLDLPLGIVDAAVAAIAERLGLAEITALDHRHFTVIRPRHVQAFTLLPGPGHALSSQQRRFCSCRQQETRPHQALPECHHAARQEDHKQRWSCRPRAGETRYVGQSGCPPPRPAACASGWCDCRHGTAEQHARSGWDQSGRAHAGQTGRAGRCARRAAPDQVGEPAICSFRRAGQRALSWIREPGPCGRAGARRRRTW